MSGLDAQRVEAAAATLGPECIGLVADVRDETAMAVMYDDVVARLGGLDIVVANAVVGDSNPLGAITEAQLNNIFDTDVKGVLRSEEHTSELQSLMRISYAVFCLKKKTTTLDTTYINNITHL